MAFTEIIGAITILASLYFIGITISRAIILSARRQDVEMAEKEVHIKRQQLRLLEGEMQEMELLGAGDSEFQEEARKRSREKLEVIIGELVEPKNES